MHSSPRRPPALPLALALATLACARPTDSASTPEPADSPAEASWVELFDGASLAGWVTRGGRYDGDAAWTVEDGALTGRQGPRGAGGLIYTEGIYADFVFEVDVRIDYPFDSGIFVRMVPDQKGAQVTIDHRPGGEIGGIYSDGWLVHNERAAERFRTGEWHRFRVECIGADLALRAWLDGEPLCEHRLPSGSTGYAERGRIGLQVHAGEDVPPDAKVQFRRVRVRELDGS